MMADFSFLDNLSPEQSAIAEKIAQEAIKRGINPRFAVALAWTENKFTDKPGKIDEIGIMQVRPGTAKQYGYNPKDLLNPDRNIEIGLDILRRHLDTFGRDPYAAAAAYNVGPGHPLLTGKGDADLPASTKKYIEEIQSFGGFTDMPQEEQPQAKPPEITAPTAQLKPMPPPERKPLMPPEDLAKTAEAITKPIVQDPLRVGADVGAAAAGAALAGGAKPPSLPAAPSVSPSGGPVGGPAGPVGGPATPDQQQATRILQGNIKPGGVTGRQGMAFNAITAQQAARTGESTSLIDQLRQKGVVGKTAPQLLAEYPDISATQSGVYAPRHLSTPDVPPRVGQPQPQGPSMASRMSQGMSNINQRVAGIPTRAFGALGGLGAAEGAMEAKHRAETGDIPGAALASVGALGSLLSLFPPMRIVGTAATIASPLGMVLLDRIRDKPQDVMPLPAIYSRYQR